MTKLILIRHGVTQWNKEGRYCGRKDVALSGKGKSQARLLSSAIETMNFDVIYCSDRKRAMQTARILFGRKKMVRHKGLREIDFGVLEGLRHGEIMEKYADIYGRWLKDSFRNNIPGAEPMDLFRRRVESAMRDIVGPNSGKTVAVVCHGGVIGIFLNAILKRKNFWRYVPSPTGVTTVEHRRGRYRLKKFNDTAHLKGTKDE
ncbi:MAG: histidine phosphatase family protein [Candidatus Omnitrophica bacterium]|nr:histidine phosphatase family protein [Candidatus Omnitrophota bacterium]